MDGLTYEFVMNPANEAFAEKTLNDINEPYRTMSRQEKQDMNALWESTFTEVVSPEDKTIDVRLFEDDSMVFRLSFDGIQKLDSMP